MRDSTIDHQRGDSKIRILTFENYYINTRYDTLNNNIIIISISINLKDELIYKYNIRKNDSLEHIIEIFGNPFPVNGIRINESTVSYYYALDRLSMQRFIYRLTDDKLIALDIINPR